MEDKYYFEYFYRNSNLHIRFNEMPKIRDILQSSITGPQSAISQLNNLPLTLDYEMESKATITYLFNIRGELSKMFSSSFVWIMQD